MLSYANNERFTVAINPCIMYLECIYVCLFISRLYNHSSVGCTTRPFPCGVFHPVQWPQIVLTYGNMWIRDVLLKPVRKAFGIQKKIVPAVGGD